MTTTKINLLPWREQRRKEKQIEFLAMLGFVAFVAIVIVGILYLMANTALSVQQQRNAYIQHEISLLDNQISEIQALESRRAELVERMRVIQELQGNRPTIVYVFDELARTLPDGVFYTNVTRNGDTFTINGLAESNSRIARLMRNLGDSPWFGDPVLSTVQAAGGTRGAEGFNNQFTLTVSQSSPATGEDE